MSESRENRLRRVTNDVESAARELRYAMEDCRQKVDEALRILNVLQIENLKMMEWDAVPDAG